MEDSYSAGQCQNFYLLARGKGETSSTLMRLLLNFLSLLQNKLGLHNDVRRQQNERKDYSMKLWHK